MNRSQVRQRQLEPVSSIFPIGFSIAVALDLMTGLECFAGNSHLRAVAAVAIARTALEIVDEQPMLPDQPRSNSLTPPSAVADPGIAQKKPSDDDALDSPEATQNSNAASALPKMFSSMRIEFAKATVISDSLPAQLVIAIWERGCPACVRLEHTVKTVLGPLGWSIGNQITDQIQFVRVPQTETVPQITLYQNGTAIQTWNSYVDPGTLSHALRKAWDDAPPLGPTVTSSQQSGSAGTIRGQSQIQRALTWWRANIGEQNKVSLCWDRSGAQVFPLLAKGDWSAVSLFGKTGHMNFSVKEAVRLPIDSFGFGYQIRGQDVICDLDPIALAGLASHLGPVKSRPATAAVPAQFIDPLTAWNIFSMIKGIYELLYPSCDLQLPGQISATAVLTGDTLSVDFQQCPSIKIATLFTFQMNVRRVEITTASVRLLFSGSRIIKERTFSVE